MKPRNSKLAKKNPHANALDEKIFFAVKFWLMSVFQGTALIIIVFFLGQIDALGLILLGIVLFCLALIISRRFDSHISALALFITSKVNKHPKLRSMILANI